MKLHRYFILAVLLFSSTFSSCDKDYFDINRDPNAPSEVSEALMLTGILAHFSYEVIGGYPPRITNLWTKHLADATPIPHIGTYDLDENDVNNFWSYTSYTDVMNTSMELIELAKENGNPKYSAIAKIIIAWNMSYVTDLFGDAPFSQAFKGTEGTFKPAYDTQEEIYKQLQNLLDEAIVEADQASLKSPGTDDNIYRGNMSQWKKMANTLKARLHLHLTNAPGYHAATQAEKVLQALNAGALSSNDDMPTYAYLNTPAAENPWYQYAIDGKWGTFTRPSQFYVDTLLGLSDPRIAWMATKVTEGPSAGQYVGATNDGANPTKATERTAIHPFYSAANAPVYWFIYAEVPFMRAEAEFLKAGKMVTPAVVQGYNAGIAASMSMYRNTAYATGTPIPATAITAYQAAHALNPARPEEAYAKIILQKYIANYLHVEPYNDYRRTGYPDLTLNEAAVIDIIPLRFPVPSSERSYNADNINKLSIPIGLPNLKVPVWWDSK